MKALLRVGILCTAVCFLATQQLITIDSVHVATSDSTTSQHLKGFLQGHHHHPSATEHQHTSQQTSQNKEKNKNDNKVQNDNNKEKNDTNNAKLVNGELQWKSVEYEKRQFASEKILFFLHIHKSGGTAFCNLAKFQMLSTSSTNCNVQVDQRCCGNQDTLQAQADYAQSAVYDFVAAEGRMYDSMDVNHYNYILIFRQSMDRYYSHWKAVKQVYRQLPPSMQMENDEEDILQAAGGIGVAGQAILTHHKGAAPLQQNEQMEAQYNHMVDLVRETKEQRVQRRQQKMAEMEMWKQQAVQVQEEFKHQQQQPIQQQQAEAEPIPFQNEPPPPPPELKMEDFTLDADKNLGIFMPNRRRRRLQEEDEESSVLQHLQVALSPQSRQKLVNELHELHHPHDDNKPPPLIPHPAQDPATAFREGQQFQMPVFGRTFQEWWQTQPDNWNFRQLCGTHCQSVPKYQLTMEHWSYTLSRLLRFDTVLFLEDLDASLQVLASRHPHYWNQSRTLHEMNMALYQHEQATAIQKEKSNAKRTIERTDAEWKEWYRKKKEDAMMKKMRVPEEDRRFKKKQLQKWDPLMSAVDDALYNVAQRWETLKQKKEKQQQQQSTDITNQELGTISDLYSLPQQIHEMLQFYMDEDGVHRQLCENECCESQCSAW
ncbi:expressed unknown protein [Seminavis robusta]|uniref:Uncharacterized protein n=1 Tax=Seminavis robusta TaxID=568900 RepID=A0A9N8DGB9_9STRA|nr:expressed unknown protein [Seminavis robusta]|eukprot:Sro74_g040730.1 n/a (656) ;mRNA; r:49220-51187